MLVISSVHNVDTLKLLPTIITTQKMETEDYLQKSVGNILAILNKPKNQLPF